MSRQDFEDKHAIRRECNAKRTYREPVFLDSDIDSIDVELLLSAALELSLAST